MSVKKNEVLLWIGRWTSKIGNIVFDYANSVSIVNAFSTKPWVLAIYQSSETIIQVICNLIGGAKADSGNRKKIVIITDLISSLICFLLSFAIDSPFMAEVMVIANALLAVVTAFNSPTTKALLREMIERDRLGFFNSIQNSVGELINIVGPFIGVLLVRLFNVKVALLFDAFTFLVSAIVEFFLQRIDEINPIRVKKNIVRGIIEGFQYLWKEKQILCLILLSALVNFFLAGYNLMLPFTDIIYENYLEGFYSKALAAQSIGGIIGSAINTKLKPEKVNNIKVQVIALGFTGLALVLEPIFTFLKLHLISLGMFVFFGAALTIFNIQFVTFVQLIVVQEFLGRVFSIIYTVAVMFMPIGSIVFSFLCDVEKDSSFAVVGLGIVVLAVVFYFILMRRGQGESEDSCENLSGY